MIEKSLDIRNRLGLHARAAAKLVHVASRYKSKITIDKDGQEVDGKSILGILLLAASQGCQIKVSANGDDEDSAIRAIEDLVDGKFGEED